MKVHETVPIHITVGNAVMKLMALEISFLKTAQQNIQKSNKMASTQIYNHLGSCLVPDGSDR
jgi:hypothetical protein